MTKKLTKIKKSLNPISRKLTNGANKITKYLKQAKVKFKLLKHKIVFTAHDAAQTTKKKINEIAKVVLVKADKDFVLIVLPAGKYVDFNGIKKALKAKKVSMANEKDIAKYLKTKVGLLHPFGNLYHLPPPPHPTLSPLSALSSRPKGKGARGISVLLDKGLAKAKKMVASAESYTESVEIALKDFEKLVKPIKGVFAKSKR